MQNVSEEFKQAISQPSREIESRITFPDLALDDYQVRSINLNSLLVGSDDFEIGTAPMDMVKVELVEDTEDEWGRNLLKNSDFSNGLTGWCTTSSGIVSIVDDNDFYKVCKVEASDRNQGIYRMPTTRVLTAGETYTLVAMVKADDEMSIGVAIDGSGLSNGMTKTIGTSWEKVVFTKVSSGSNTQSRIYSNSSGTFYIAWIKTEKGSIATPWSPAPEDYANYDYENKECEIELGLTLPDESVEYASMGKYTVEKANRKNNVITLDCVDRMYKAEKDYISDLMYPATLLDILQSACDQAGIELATTTFANSDYIVPNEPVYEDVTCRQVFAQVAELAGGYAKINRLGQLEIVTLGSESVRDITKDHYIDFRRDEVAIGKIDRVIVKVGDETAEQGTGEDIYTIVDNMFVQDPNNVVGPLYNVLKNVSYTACSLKWQGDFSLDLGDKITIDGHDTYILDRSLKYTGGLRETYRAPAKSNIEKESTGKRSLTLEMANYKSELRIVKEGLSYNIEKVEEVEGDLGDLADRLEEAELKIEPGRIVQTVRQSEEYLNDLGEIKDYTDNSLSAYADTVTASLDDLSTKVDKAITTYFSVGVPTLDNYPADEWEDDDEKNTHLGDLYFDEATGYSYRFVLNNGNFGWVQIQDTDITLALAKANQAQDTADGKRRTFISQPTPPYDEGDLWTQGANGELMRCVNARQSGNYVASDWEKATKYTDDTAVDSLKIGGRNLELDSHFYGGNINGWGYAAYFSRTVIDDVLVFECIRTHGANRIEKSFNYLKVGEIYTLTVFGDFPKDIEWRSFENASVESLTPIQVTPGEFKAYSVTFRVTDSGNVIVRGYMPNLPVGTKAYMDWYKLEKGTKATDWTPAPEDVDEAISTVDTKYSNKVAEINTSLDGITQRVSSTETVVSTINDEVVSLESRVNSAEQQITPNAIVQTVRSSTAYTNDLSGKVDTTQFESYRLQTAQLIEDRVEKDGVIAAISLSPETAKIQANKIKLEGLVTANSNFKILTDGSIEAKNATISGTISSSTITGTTITGGTVRTSSSGDRIQLSDNLLRAYASGIQRVRLDTTSLRFYDPTGALGGYIFADTSHDTWSTIFSIQPSSTGYISLHTKDPQTYGSDYAVIQVIPKSGDSNLWHGNRVRLETRGTDVASDYAHVELEDGWVDINASRGLSVNGTIYLPGGIGASPNISSLASYDRQGLLIKAGDVESSASIALFGNHDSVSSSAMILRSGGQVALYLGASGDARFYGNLRVDGAITSSTIIELAQNTRVTGWLQPKTNNTYSLGGGSSRWSRIYLQYNPDVASDIRLKSSIQNIPNGLLAELKEIKPKMYKQGEKWHFGYVAQDVERALYKYALKTVGWDKAKDYVREFELLYKDESYLSLIYAEIAVLKEAEMQARIDELETRLLALEQAS